MKNLIKKLSSCVLPKDQLLPLIEDHTFKKHKQYDQILPWVEVVKRLLTRAADTGSEVLSENTSTVIRLYLPETVKVGMKHPRKFGQKYSDTLNSLLTHLHFTMDDANLQVAEMNTLSSLILAAVIDMLVAAHKKGEEASVVAKIFMKLSIIFGHSQEQLLDALFHCKTLIHPRSRQPSIQVPLIKRLFSSMRSGQTMTPVLYLKYLLLGKLWLFMTEKKELGKNRTYIAKVLKLPEDISNWAKKEKVPWLKLPRWNTRLILKNMTLLGALETFYGYRHEEISASHKSRVQRGKSSTISPVKIKTHSSKLRTNKSVDEKVKTENNKFLRPPSPKEDSDEDVKLELQIINLKNEVTDDETLPCSSRTNESNIKQKKKRKSIGIAENRKKRKIENNVKEETIKNIHVFSKSTLPEKTKSGSSKSSVNKNVHKEKKEVITCNKITKALPEMLISEADSEDSIKEEVQIVDVNSHVAAEGSLFSNKSILRKGAKRKSEEILEQKVKKGKIQNHKNDKDTNITLTSKEETITVKKKHKKCKKNSNTDHSNNSNAAYVYLDKPAESEAMREAESFSGSSSANHPEEGKLHTIEKSLKKRSRKRLNKLLVKKEDSRDEVNRNSSMFEEVSTSPANDVSLETLNNKERRESSRKRKLSKKQQKVRRRSMTFTVTELEVKRDNLVAEEFEDINGKNIEELNVNEVNQTESVYIMPTEEQTTDDGKIASTDFDKEINCNDPAAIEHQGVQNVSANRCSTSSENGSDNDLSVGDDNDLENNKTELELEKSTSCMKEKDNLSEVSSGEDQAVCKDDGEHNDGWKSSSEYSVDSIKETLVQTKCNSTKTPEKDSRIFDQEQQHDSFSINSDTDSNSEEEDVTIDISSNEDRDDEIVVENGPNKIKDECDSILGTNNRSNVFVKENDASEKLLKNSGNSSKDSENGSDLEIESKLIIHNVSDEGSNSEDELIITKCSIQEIRGKDIKIDSSTEEGTINISSSDQDGGGKDNMVTVEKIEGTEHFKDDDRDNVDDSKLINKSCAGLIAKSECEAKVALDNIPKTPEGCVLYDGDSNIIEAPDTDQAIISCKELDNVTDGEDTKNRIQLKEEPLVIEVDNVLEEEVKQEKDVETSDVKPSSSRVKDTSRIAKIIPSKKSPTDPQDTTTPPPPSEHRKEPSQDPVSKMMNNFYKSNVLKIDDEEKEGNNNEIRNSEILNSQQNATPPVVFKESPPSAPCDDDDDDDVIIEDGTDEIESMLENIVKDTGRPTSIHGLRERLLSHTSVKEEQTENTPHEVEKDEKESSDTSIIPPPCVSQVRTPDPPLGPLDVTLNDSVEPVNVKEDIDTLVESIVKDESRLADVRDLREKLLCKASITETRLESSECEVEKKDNDKSCYDFQVTRTEDNLQNVQPNDVDEASLDNDTLSSDTLKEKNDIKEELCIIGLDKHLRNSKTENELNIPNDDATKSTDDSNINFVTIDKAQETSKSNHIEKRDLDNNQTDQPICIASYSTNQENDPAGRVDTTEEISQKTLDTESVEKIEAERLTDASTDDSLTLVLKLSNTEEIESVMDESLDKSTEGADEAYEASSDASDDAAPRTRRRSRSLRKFCAHQEMHLASDSDSSPVRATRCRPAALHTANWQRLKRKRSQSCSLDSVSSFQESLNSTKTLEKSANKTFTFEKEYLFNETFTVKSRKASHVEASSLDDINSRSNEEELFVTSDEIKQDVVSAESDETSIVKNINSSLSSKKIVVDDITNDATKSSSRSQSSQNIEVLNQLTMIETYYSSPSDTTVTESFNKSSIPCKINTDAASQDEPSSHSTVMEDPESCMSPNEGEMSFDKLTILSNENSSQSQDFEMINEQNSLSKDGNQKSLSDTKESENKASPEFLRLEELYTSDNAGPALDMEKEPEHEEIGREIDQDDKHIDNELNQERAEQILEGEEIEVLSTSEIEEKDEKEVVGMTPEVFDDDEARKKADPLISKKSLRSHIRQLYLPKDGKDVNSNSGSKDCRLAPIPLIKAQCLSQVALTKEVLISPDVSDEECELVSREEDLTDVKAPIEVDHLEDSTPHENVSLCFSKLNLQKSNGGINSPHKTIPEEQDESTIPKSSSDPKACIPLRSKTLTISPLLSISGTEKLDDRNIHTRRSSRGMTCEDPSGSQQDLEMSKSIKSQAKSSRTLSSIQEEHTDVSDHESTLNTSNKLATENIDQKRKETVTNIPKDSESLVNVRDSVSISSHSIENENKGKKLQTSSPSNEDSGEKCNGSISPSQERILPSQNQISEPLCEDSDHKHKSEMCESVKLLSAKNNASDDSEDDIVLKEYIRTHKSPISSLTKEESSRCDTPRPSVRRVQQHYSPSSSSSVSSGLPSVRRSSRLRKLSNDVFSLTKDSRISDSSNVSSENERATEQIENKCAPGTPKDRRRSLRCVGTPRKAPSEAAD